MTDPARVVGQAEANRRNPSIRELVWIRACVRACVRELLRVRGRTCARTRPESLWIGAVRLSLSYSPVARFPDGSEPDKSDLSSRTY